MPEVTLASSRHLDNTNKHSCTKSKKKPVLGDASSLTTGGATFKDECPATKILEKRRELAQVEEELEQRKEDFVKEVEESRQREDALRKKDLSLQESVIEYNKFLQENENKRTRAIRRYEEEKRICGVKDQEIKNLEETFETKEKEKQHLASELSLNRKYQDYLKSVIEEVKRTSGEYTEIEDIIDQYRILKKINNDLIIKMAQNTKDHESSRSEHLEFMKQNANEILNLNNEIASLQNSLEQTTIASNNMKDQDERTQRKWMDQTVELCQIVNVIDHIVKRFENQPQHPESGKKSSIHSSSGEIRSDETVEEKRSRIMKNLDKISDYMLDYGSMAEEWIKQQQDDEINSK